MDSTMFRVKVNRHEDTELHEQVAAEIRCAIGEGEAITAPWGRTSAIFRRTPSPDERRGRGARVDAELGVDVLEMLPNCQG